METSSKEALLQWKFLGAKATDERLSIDQEAVREVISVSDFEARRHRTEGGLEEAAKDTPQQTVLETARRQRAMERAAPKREMEKAGPYPRHGFRIRSPSKEASEGIVEVSARRSWQGGTKEKIRWRTVSLAKHVTVNLYTAKGCLVDVLACQIENVDVTEVVVLMAFLALTST